MNYIGNTSRGKISFWHERSAPWMRKICLFHQFAWPSYLPWRSKQLPGSRYVCLTLGPYPFHRQNVDLQKQVTLFLFDHEKPSDSDQIISTFYEYKLQVSQTYLCKFDQPYAVFESELTIHRQVIPLKRNMLKVLSDAVQRAATGPGDAAETAAYTDREAAITNSPYPVDSTKRKVLDESDSNILVKRVKSGNHKGKEWSDVV